MILILQYDCSYLISRQFIKNKNLLFFVIYTKKSNKSKISAHEKFSKIYVKIVCLRNPSRFASGFLDSNHTRFSLLSIIHIKMRIMPKTDKIYDLSGLDQIPTHYSTRHMLVRYTPKHVIWV
jgi:hypothetical protein